MTGVHILPQAKFEFKCVIISQQNLMYTIQILPDMLPLNPHICQCMGQFFVKRPKFLAATSIFVKSKI